jgi:allophanate hydrolase subunit 2
VNSEIVQAFGVVGRHGRAGLDRRRFGVPPGGAFDREALALLNALLGMPEESPAWELGMANVRFRVLEDGMMAVVGARAGVTVDGHGAASQAAFPVHSGAEVHIGPPETGARVYVSARAGVRGRIRRLSTSLSYDLRSPLRVVAGPQGPLFDLDRLTFGTFRVSMSSDRVGIRLEGKFPGHDMELPSEPACVGAIQVTGSGGLVILGPDGPTIGGYPKAAVVIDADLDRLAQLRPGDSVAFSLISLEEARDARRARLERIARTVAELRLHECRLRADLTQ